MTSLVTVRRGAPGAIVHIGSEAARGGAPVPVPYAAPEGGLATPTCNAAQMVVLLLSDRSGVVTGPVVHGGPAGLRRPRREGTQ